ncbi:MAG: chromate transporter [Anaerovoracaceae bacterium]|jgi:chromate transporter
MNFLSLFWVFFRIGLFGFGGGYAILPMIYQGAQEFGIMEADEFSRLVAISQITPGPIAINGATYVGYQYAGIPGAMVATFGAVLPSLILVYIVFSFIIKFKKSAALENILGGVRPATVGLLASAVVFLAEESIFNGRILAGKILEDPIGYLNPIPILFFLITLIIYARFKISPIKLTVYAGIAGALMIR